jgi:hypothetical protein
VILFLAFAFLADFIMVVNGVSVVFFYGTFAEPSMPEWLLQTPTGFSIGHMMLSIDSLAVSGLGLFSTCRLARRVRRAAVLGKKVKRWYESPSLRTIFTVDKRGRSRIEWKEIRIYGAINLNVVV